ncbi:hypothetical protein [Nevskia soli]|uniref:hypothetical protein n=1 Tax=Nevskia soli TaxID=418856 RepID=UPI0004A77711|nr:hypothetical protein [Nevskia soli]
MNAFDIKLGIVVRAKHGIIGIVCSKEGRPPEDWIDEQVDSQEIRGLGQTEWWGILLFTGGYALSPGPMLEYLREASYDDFLSAVDTANVSGRKHLAKVFPAYVDRVLAERRDGAA